VPGCLQRRLSSLLYPYPPRNFSLFCVW
jgi:hypothetical protein